MRRFVVPILAAIAGFALARGLSGFQHGPGEASTTASEARPVEPEPVFPQAHNSPLAAAVRVVDSIEAMTLADFQVIANDPSKFPMLDEEVRKWDVRDAHLEALVERWLTVDPNGGFAAIRRTIDGLGRIDSNLGYLAKDLSRTLAKQRPVETLASLPAKLEKEDQLWHELCPAMEALGQRDIRAAKLELERFTEKQARDRALHAMARGLAKEDPVAAAALARLHGSTEMLNDALMAASRAGRETMRQVIAAAGEKLRPNGDFSELMLRYPDEDWQSMLGKDSYFEGALQFPRMIEARRVSGDERLRLLEQFDKLPNDGGSKISDSLMRAWTLDDPKAALNWALAKSNGKTDPRLRTALDFWVGDDAGAARAWISQLPDSPQKTELGNRLAAGLAAKGDIDGALEFFVPGSGKESLEALGGIGLAKSDSDPAGAIMWMASLPEKAEAYKVIEWNLGAWFNLDPSAVASWIETLPKGMMRDKALHGFGYQAKNADPFTAGEWAATIDDPKTKTDIAISVFRNMDRHDPAAARAWLQKIQGIDPVWRDHFLRLGIW